MSVFLGIGGQPNGPYTTDQLQALWQGGQVPPDALFWFDGMSQWLPIDLFQAPSEPRIDPAAVVLTTSTHFAARDVLREVEIVTAECVFGMNVLRDFMAGLSDVFGGRSETTQDFLRRARTTALSELRKEAAALGADGVLGVALAYSELTGQGKSMLFLVASGTAVKLRPVPPPLP